MTPNLCTRPVYLAPLASWLALGACARATGDELGLASAALAQFAAPDFAGYSTRNFADPLRNRCTEDMVAGFGELPSAPTGKLRYRSMGGQRLPPFNAKLRDFAAWDPHIQSVARLSLPWADNRWMVVSRSNPGHIGAAGIFMVYLDGVQGAEGTRWVYPGDDFTGEPPANRRTHLYYPLADTDHPGGMQAVGDYLVVAAEAPEGSAPFVEILQRVTGDVAYSTLQRFTLYGDLGEPVAPSRFITAVALTQLRNGSYLLFVLGKDEEQQGWFYRSDAGPLNAETAWSFLGHVALPDWYQNVGLIDECDTRDVYLLATNNVDFDGSASSGTEYADLMRVTWNAESEQVEVPLISSRTFGAGGGGYCTFRAGAHAFIDLDGRLALYCHAYKANTDVLGRADSKLKLVEYAP